MSRFYRPPQRDDPERYWIPARMIGRAVPCSFCGFTIQKGKPGTTTGTRGTKAYYNTLTREWECMGCREEGSRASAARSS